MTVETNYWSYLLRVWRESAQDPWRAMLEDPHTGERLAFADAERLLAFLNQQFNVENPGETKPPPTRGPQA